jgi:hypothetical protein
MAVAIFAMGFAIVAGEARGGESYYVLIFGSQSHPKLLRYTHTWATFIRAVGEGPDPNDYALELHTISWLPRSLEVQTWRLLPTPGVNLDLYSTLDVVGRHHEHVTMWGPFTLKPDLYERAIEVERTLQSGEIEYRAIDGSTDLDVSDCIHAVAAVDPVFGRGHYPLIRIGIPASRYIARQYMTRSPYDQWQDENAWLISRLGLDRYPIQVVLPQRIPKRNCFLCRCPD